MLDIDTGKPRQIIEDAIERGDVANLLRLNGLLHGHYCPFSALGVKAATRAVKELAAKSTGMEEVIAIVESNNCFSDGVQFVTGCTFGNNALIYRDYGKTAFTLANRGGQAVRIAVKIDQAFLNRLAPETMSLFHRVVAERKGTNEENNRLQELWRDLSFSLITLSDEEVFTIQYPTIDMPAYARIFASMKCSICGENVMGPRAQTIDGQSVCIPCSGGSYYELSGNGMSVIVSS